jgi:hypothetical protein
MQEGLSTRAAFAPNVEKCRWKDMYVVQSRRNTTVTANVTAKVACVHIHGELESSSTSCWRERERERERDLRHEREGASGHEMK